MPTPAHVASSVNSHYEQFLAAKRLVAPAAGFDPDEINPTLFDFQRDVVRWACRKGKAAIWLDCGLGKGGIQLEWAKQVHEHAYGDVLILAPLAVAQQTKREADKFGITAPVTVCRSQDDVRPGINITNYEMLHHFDPTHFVGVVADESSILKSQTGSTRTALIDAFSATPYRLACTATPAPNDHMELGNHAEFLGVMTGPEMLAMFFVHDGGDTQSWRLKGHAEHAFWEWVASWAVLMRRPSDLDYDDGGFALPEGGPVIARTLTASERLVREHALAINLGRCTWCDRQATNACHRLPEGQGGPYIIPNLLPGCGSGTHGDHWRTEQHRRLSYACGWLIRSDTGPASRSARIAATPALIRTPLAPHGAWHLLDSLEDGRPLGMPRLAEPDEVPDWMWPGSFVDAVAKLHGRSAA